MRAILWASVIFVCLLIFYLSSQPSLPLPARISDKFYHLMEYALLGFLSVLALRATFNISLRRALAVAILFSILYAISDEWHQSFVPGRDASLTDLAADAAGSLMGALFALSFRWPFFTR